jgi:hypothetical protein
MIHFPPQIDDRPSSPFRNLRGPSKPYEVSGNSVLNNHCKRKTRILLPYTFSLQNYYHSPSVTTYIANFQFK